MAQRRCLWCETAAVAIPYQLGGREFRPVPLCSACAKLWDDHTRLIHPYEVGQYKPAILKRIVPPFSPPGPRRV